MIAVFWYLAWLHNPRESKPQTEICTRCGLGATLAGLLTNLARGNVVDAFACRMVYVRDSVFVGIFVALAVSCSGETFESETNAYLLVAITFGVAVVMLAQHLQAYPFEFRLLNCLSLCPRVDP